MWANGSPFTVGGDHIAESQEHRPHRVLRAAVGDDHLADRLRLAFDIGPDAEPAQHANGGRRHRRGAAVASDSRRRLRIGDDDAKFRRRLGNRQRRAQADMAAAGD